jgi:hypothetical protein
VLDCVPSIANCDRIIAYQNLQENELIPRDCGFVFAGDKPRFVLALRCEKCHAAAGQSLGFFAFGLGQLTGGEFLAIARKSRLASTGLQANVGQSLDALEVVRRECQEAG